MKTYRIRPLEWETCQWKLTWLKAKTCVGRYNIDMGDRGIVLAFIRDTTTIFAKKCKSVKHAKRAARKDYIKRLMASLDDVH